MNYCNELKENWSKHLKLEKLRAFLALSILLLITLLILFPKFLLYIESRQGMAFADPLASWFTPIDLTWPIFMIIYISLIAGLLHFAKEPRVLLTAINSYTIMLALRAAAMFMLPLEPPATMIPLNDPFVETFGSGALLTKDLFFSGHTATLFLLYLNTKSNTLRKIFGVSAILVAVAVILQHVHYSADVFAAPFFAYTAYLAACRLNGKLK